MQRRVARMIGLAAAAAAAVAGCAAPEQRFVEYDYRLKHPIRVGTKTAGLVLEAPGGAGFSDQDRRRLFDFARDYQARGVGAIEISVEAASADDAEARQLLRQIVTVLVEDGVPAERLRPQLVLDGPVTAPRTAVLMTRQHVADLPECGLEHTYEAGYANAPSSEFGCSVQHNIGAMVVNPQDLIRARRATPPPVDRAVRTMEGYRAGGDEE